MLTLLINETKPLAGLFASTTGGIGSVPDISVADDGQAVSVQTFTRTAGVITDSFVAGDVLHIGIGDGVNAPVCYIELSSASPATGTMAVNTVGMVALFAATSANQLKLTLGIVRTRGAYTNTIFSAPIVIHRSVIDPDTAVPTPSILGTGVAAALLVAINTALGFVRLDASARLPAVDGSQLTNVPNELPSQTGNSGKYLTTNGTATSWGAAAGGVTSITGTANEITVTGTTTPTLSLPSALTFTGKTVTGGTFNSPTLFEPSSKIYKILDNQDGTRKGQLTNDFTHVYLDSGGDVFLRSTDFVSSYLSLAHFSASTGRMSLGTSAFLSGKIGFKNATSTGTTTLESANASANDYTATLQAATGTLALVSGNLGTPSALVGTNISGTAASLTAGLVTSIGSLTGDVTSSNRATTLATVNANVGAFTNASLTVNAKGLVTAASSGTSAVTSITGTANEITVTGTTTPTLSLPSALTFTGKTVTGGTFTGGAFNGTVGATTPSTVAGTTGTFSDAVITNGASAPIYTTGAASYIYTENASAFIQTRSTFRLYNGVYTTTLNHSAASSDKTATFPNATGTIALTSDITGGTLAGSFTTLTASATTSLLLGTAGSAVGNVGFRNATSGTTTLQPATGALGTGTVTLPLSGTLATLDGTETLTNKSIAATQLTGTIADARNTVSNSTTTTMSALTSATITTTPAANTVGTALLITDTTAATSGNQQYSGAIRWTGQGWKTTATAASQAVDFRSYVIPVQGTTNPTANLIFDYAVNGGAFGTALTLSSVGDVIAGNHVACGASGAFYVNPNSAFSTYKMAFGATSFNVPSGFAFLWSSDSSLGSGAKDTSLSRNAAGVLQFGTTAANASGSWLATNGTLSGTLAVTGATTLTGNLTSNGAYISTPQALSGNGAVAAVNLTTEVTTIANTGTANTTTTLAAGTNGQKKVISFITDGGFDAVITVTNPAWGGAGTITMNDALDNIELRYLNSVWQVFINNGCTLA